MRQSNIIYPSQFNKKKKSDHPYLVILLFALIFAILTYVLGMLTLSPATYTLIGINAIVFVLVKTKKFGIQKLGMNSYYVEKDKEYYRIVSSAFTHEEPWHILMNMYSMYNIGSVLEPILGTKLFIELYLIILIVGGSLSCLVHRRIQKNALSIGASGTICGMFGLYAAIALKISGIYGIRAVLPTLLMLVLMTASKRIDSIGHFSGLAVGIVCGICLFR